MGRSQILQEENQNEESIIIIQNEFEDVIQLVDFYKNIKKTFKKCKSLQKEFLETQESFKEKILKKQIEQAIFQLKNAIDQLKQKIYNVRTTFTTQRIQYDAVVRMKFVICQLLTNKEYYFLKELLKFSYKFKEATEKKMSEQLQIYNSNLTDKQIKRIVKDPQVIQKAI